MINYLIKFPNLIKKEKEGMKENPLKLYYPFNGNLLEYSLTKS